MIIGPGFGGFLKKNRENKADRPVVRPEMSPADWLLEAIAAAGLLALAGYAIYQYPHLPETIPSHFDSSGHVDDYSSRATIWFLPGISLFIYVLLSLIMLIPHQFNYTVKITPANALRQYTLATRLVRYLKAIIIWLFFFITFEIVSGARGASDGLGIWFLPVFLGIIFVPMIIYFMAAARNK